MKGCEPVVKATEDVQEHIDDVVAIAVRRERERCAELCIARAEIADIHAAEIREQGTFTGSSLHLTWPFVRPEKFVAGKWEQRARDHEAVGNSYRMLARGIMAGWDVRKEIDPGTRVSDTDIVKAMRC
jgi:hypothetical protein